MAEGRKNVIRKRLLKKRQSASYARKLFSRMKSADVTGWEKIPPPVTGEEQEDIAEDTGELILAAGKETVTGGASLISRVYQKAGIKMEYEEIRAGKTKAGAAGSFVSGFRPALDTMFSRMRKAFDREQIAGRFHSAIAQKGPYLLFFAPVLLSLLVLVGITAAIPLVLEGGTTIAMQNGKHYEVSREYLTDEKFARMIEEGEKYLGYPYVWGGGTPLTGFDCSGYVSWVLNHSGWHIGRLTANQLLAFCTLVPASEAKPGDLVFFQGTYDTAGASHLGIYVGDKMMLHCGDPIGYTRIDTEFWKEHYLCFGRLPDP